MLGARAVPSLGFEPSPALLRLGKSSHSKYRGLAAWRHAALWQRALGAVEDAEFLAALRCVYFTPCADAPPFSWSRAAGRAPGVDRFSGPAELKRWAAEGAYCVLKALRELGSGLRRGRTWDEEVRAMLLRPAIRRTLEDVLKLEEFSR